MSMFKFALGLLVTVGVSFTLLSGNITEFDFQTQKLIIDIEASSSQSFDNIDCNKLLQDVSSCKIAKYQKASNDYLSDVLVRYVVIALLLYAILFALCVYSWILFALNESRCLARRCALLSVLLNLVLWLVLTHKPL